MIKKSRIKNFNNFFKAYVFFAVFAKKIGFDVSENPSQSTKVDFFKHLNQFKLFKKIVFNRIKMDLSEICMDFSESENHQN